MKLVRNHGVTAPAGFKAAVSARAAVALVVNEGPDQTAAGIFSADEDKAAAVLWTQQVLSTGRARVVLIHAGRASTSDVPADFGHTHRAAEELATTLSDCGSETGAVEVAVCATGRRFRPVEALLAGTVEAVHKLAGGIVGGAEAARSAGGGQLVQVVGQHEDGWTVGGLADTQATVCVLTTDAIATPAALHGALSSATERLSGANAAVLLLASGASEVQARPAALVEAVTAVYADLRQQAPGTPWTESA